MPAAKIRSVIQGAARVLGESGLWPQRLERISVVLLPDKESQAISRRYRKKQKPANVLSFHYGTWGELVLAPREIHNQARAEKGSFQNAFDRMLIHGLIHLVGVHHEYSDSGERYFARLERRLLLPKSRTAFPGPQKKRPRP